MDPQLPSEHTPEAMGLRLEPTSRLGLLDAFLVLAFVASAMTWVWASIVGPDPSLFGALATPLGRTIAVLVGAASIVAVVRALLVRHWPASENDRGLV